MVLAVRLVSVGILAVRRLYYTPLERDGKVIWKAP